MFGDIILASSVCKLIKKENHLIKIYYISGKKELTETNPYINFSFEIKLPKKFELVFYLFLKFFFKNTIYVKHWLPSPNILQSYMQTFGYKNNQIQTKI